MRVLLALLVVDALLFARAHQMNDPFELWLAFVLLFSLAWSALYAAKFYFIGHWLGRGWRGSRHRDRRRF